MHPYKIEYVSCREAVKTFVNCIVTVGTGSFLSAITTNYYKEFWKFKSTAVVLTLLSILPWCEKLLSPIWLPTLNFSSPLTKWIWCLGKLDLFPSIMLLSAPLLILLVCGQIKSIQNKSCENIIWIILFAILGHKSSGRLHNFC